MTALETTTANPYLEGPFEPIDQEITAYDLQVTGKIPPELNGRLLRNGPNPIDPEDPRTYSWFSSNGMVHGVRLREGRAEWYRNRFVRDDQVDARRGVPLLPGPAHLASGLVRHTRTNNVQTNVVCHAGKLLAVAESVLPVELTYDLLSTTRTNLDGGLDGAWTGHPHHDPDTGEMHGVAYHWDWDHAQYIVVDKAGSVRRKVEVPLGGRPVIHDMALTQRFAVFQDSPVRYDETLVATGIDFPISWDFAHNVRWALVPREGDGPVIWVEGPQTAVFHILGAFDLPDGRVVVDVAENVRVFVNDHRGPSDEPARLTRILLDPATGHSSSQVLDDAAQEMPRLDERRIGHRHRYGYFVGFGDTSSLIKHDLEQGSKQSFVHGPGRVGMEAVFVPRTVDSVEDDGWLMSYVVDLTTNTTDVQILHAQDLAGGPVASIHIPARVPFGFHGNWVPDAELGR